MDHFDAFVLDVEPRLRRALIGARGPEDGRDATAEALAYAWQNWGRVRTLVNPVGYLYRVGCSKTRPRKQPRPEPSVPGGLPEFEPALLDALRDLSEAQRTCVFLVHGCGWTHPEVAEVLDITASTVSTHVQRAMANLRERLVVRA